MPAALLDYRGVVPPHPELEPVQLLEGMEYRYEFRVSGLVGPIETDRPELFDPESNDGTAGRLRPGLTVGTVPCRVVSNDRELGRLSFEVRSRKLDYLHHYRWMLRDIAEIAIEAILERFGPSEQRFGPSGAGSARSLYQSFAFLSSLLTGDAFMGAIQEVLYRPHVTWEPSQEVHRPGQGLPPSSGIARQIAMPGPRIRSADLTKVPYLPARLQVSRQIPVVDNPPNRFVKHALKTWRDHVALVQDRLSHESETAPVQRGLREAKALQATLDDLIAHKALLDVGDLRHLPLDSQVLQKRNGYREILQAYLQFQTAAHLQWDGADDVFSAGQRDVATLYEYWAFLQLARLVGEMCQNDFDLSTLFELSSSELTLKLQRGRGAAVHGEIVSHGRRFRVELFFNRSFPTSRQGSWSRPMRPDCSLQIAALDGALALSVPIWVHFDAKYRVDFVADLFGGNPTNEEESAVSLVEIEHADDLGAPIRTDLLKMHAYRDAIRRSAGAYVLYPGTEQETCIQYHELLPGLGAFGLRPTEEGPALGCRAVRQFLDDLIDHFGRQTTQHERGRYWTSEVYEGATPPQFTAPFAPFLRRPPSDTAVLIGYVRSVRQLKWIHTNLLYNLRADNRRGSVGLKSHELGADLIVLHGPNFEYAELWTVEGEPRLATREDLLSTGYPSPGGELYYCLPISGIDRGLSGTLPDCRKIAAARSRLAPRAVDGAPVITNWLDLSRELAD